MQSNLLLSSNYRPHFSGHETFPLRYGWLKNAHDQIIKNKLIPENRTIFTGDDAIARFGVGKNMVASMRHWATAVGVLTDNASEGTINSAELGSLLFGDDKTPGLDPYLENPSSLWLIHWQLCTSPHKTTWYYLFNHFTGDFFERSQIVNNLEKLAKDRNWNRIASTTIKRDVECLVRTYVAKP